MKTVAITKTSHPLLFDALDIAHHDAGCGCQAEYLLPADKAARYDAFEVELIKLSSEEVETLCIGEVDEQEAIAARSPVLKEFHTFLNEWFNTL